MNTVISKFALGLLLTLTSVTVANAAIVTYSSRAAFDAAFPGSVLEDWDSYLDQTTIPDGTAINGITYNSSAGYALVTADFDTSSSPNGLGDSLAGYFQPGDTITFTFSSALTAFGIDINTFSVSDGSYTATTSGGDVIYSFYSAFPESTTGQFVGFSSSTPFTSVTIAAAQTDSFTLDTLRGVPAMAPVPLPAAAWLLLSGLVGLGLVRGRQPTK